MTAPDPKAVIDALTNQEIADVRRSADEGPLNCEGCGAVCLCSQIMMACDELIAAKSALSAEVASAERIAELERQLAEEQHRHMITEKDACAQAEMRSESERRREAAEKMLAEADAVIASNCGGYAFPHIRGTALAPCWDWKDQAVARHAARAKEGT